MDHLSAKGAYLQSIIVYIANHQLFVLNVLMDTYYQQRNRVVIHAQQFKGVSTVKVLLCVLIAKLDTMMLVGFVLNVMRDVKHASMQLIVKAVLLDIV